MSRHERAACALSRRVVAALVRMAFRWRVGKFRGRENDEDERALNHQRNPRPSVKKHLMEGFLLLIYQCPARVAQRIERLATNQEI